MFRWVTFKVFSKYSFTVPWLGEIPACACMSCYFSLLCGEQHDENSWDKTTKTPHYFRLNLQLAAHSNAWGKQTFVLPSAFPAAGVEAVRPQRNVRLNWDSQAISLPSWRCGASSLPPNLLPTQEETAMDLKSSRLKLVFNISIEKACSCCGLNCYMLLSFKYWYCKDNSCALPSRLSQ